ncbi:MAG TPA: hypothetical protein VK633_03115, partial [Verrucomicrobiae bacterium]|nr:hypothetical protein [Verrucomicrobiae bacterium]
LKANSDDGLILGAAFGLVGDVGLGLLELRFEAGFPVLKRTGPRATRALPTSTSASATALS